jgi:guanine nucleotide-binding protein G(i) subunit alpha
VEVSFLCFKKNKKGFIFFVVLLQTKFMYKNRRFLMVDVGGQRNERKKWIHSFQEVTAILFVLGTSDYDLLLEVRKKKKKKKKKRKERKKEKVSFFLICCFVLQEDMLTNRMHDALKLFGDVVNNKWFDSVNVVVFLNKKDLFAAKIAKTSLKVKKKEISSFNFSTFFFVFLKGCVSGFSWSQHLRGRYEIHWRSNQSN